MVHGGMPSVSCTFRRTPYLPTGLPMNPKTCQAGISQVITWAASDRDSHVKFSAVNDHLSADDVNDHILHTHTYIYTVTIYIYPNIYLRAWFVYQRMASVSFMRFPKISAGCFTLRWRGGFGHRDSQVPKASWLDMSLGLFLNSTCHFLEKKPLLPCS